MVPKHTVEFKIMALQLFTGLLSDSAECVYKYRLDEMPESDKFVKMWKGKNQNIIFLFRVYLKLSRNCILKRRHLT